MINTQKSWLSSYRNARTRCTNKNCKDYPRYGGRGIRFLLTKDEIKKLWLRDNAYLMKRHSIDRIDNDGNYEYGNCRFIEMSENSKRVIQKTKPVILKNKEGKILKRFNSINEADRGGYHKSTIIRQLKGLTKPTLYYWEVA